MTAERLRASLAARYRLEGELGRGGMATVFRAHDLKHDRPVAVKVLRPELAATLGATRFLQEIKFAAGLAHPHILPVHDSGEADGYLYYVMPLVEGESLRDRLSRERQLPLEEAVHITRQIADALAFAHSHDIVHRDIKPENILFVAGHAVLADFGIARAITAAAATDLTAAGTTIGTPAYMSPEQSAGESPLDGRSDIYSLACVLYEMLAGEPPFTGPTPQAILAKRLSGPVPRISTLRETVSATLEAAITKALARAPADRFATVVLFAEALTSGAPAAPEKSIAVLPFANLSADPENEYFSDGMTEEIINALTHVPSLRVAARTSSFAFKGKNLSIQRLGDELQVSTVLEGSVRRSGNRLRITAQMINAADGYHLWSERFDREMVDVFSVQDEIAQAIVTALKVKLGVSDAPPPSVRRGTTNLDAYQLYLKGRHLWHQRGPGLQKAIRLFEQAIEADPNYADAYAGVADVLCILGAYGYLPSAPAHLKAKEAALRAVALDQDLAEGHLALGLTEYYFGWDFTIAERELRLAIAKNPQLGLPHAWLGTLLAGLHRFDEAVREAERGRELEPLSAPIHALVGQTYLFVRRYADAVAACEAGLELDPNSVPVLWLLGMSYGAQARHAEALAALRRATTLAPSSPLMASVLAAQLAFAAAADEARQVLAQLERRSTDTYLPSSTFVTIYAALGDVDRTVAWLEKALAERNGCSWFVAVMPGSDALRADRRFVSLLMAAGLGPLLEAWA